MHERDAIYAKADFPRPMVSRPANWNMNSGDGRIYGRERCATLLSELGVNDELHGMLMKGYQRQH